MKNSFADTNRQFDIANRVADFILGYKACSQTDIIIALMDGYLPIIKKEIETYGCSFDDPDVSLVNCSIRHMKYECGFNDSQLFDVLTNEEHDIKLRSDEVSKYYTEYTKNKIADSKKSLKVSISGRGRGSDIER